MGILEDISFAPSRGGRGMAQKSLDLIERMSEILDEIQPTTVRGVAYQLFNKKLIPDMGRKSVAKVSRLLVKAREDGIIPWEWIVDESQRGRRQHLLRCRRLRREHDAPIPQGLFAASASMANGRVRKINGLRCHTAGS